MSRHTKTLDCLLSNMFWLVVIVNTIGDLISIGQFVALIGYHVSDYKGLVIRQGFIESCLFRILASAAGAEAPIRHRTMF